MVTDWLWWLVSPVCVLLALMPAPGFCAQPQPDAAQAAGTRSAGHQETSQTGSGFFPRLLNAYKEEFKGSSASASGEPEPQRRALPSPWDSPPYPSSEYQGSPLIGIPPSTKEYPLMKALRSTSLGEVMAANRIKAYGWINGSYNWSNAVNSNQPSSYWIIPRSVVLEQAIVKIDRDVDTVQTDHIDWGFRFTSLYGSNYRYMTSGGWFSHQLLRNNQRYGYDPTEFYAETYIPKVAEGLILRIGRWVATPDIETQFAPDNYMATHSLQFTFDTYTQTGALATVMLNRQWTIQGAVHAGTDMAPWYRGAVPTGMLGVRWVSLDNDDAAYVVLNNINTAKFQHFDVAGQPAGHDNFNYVVGTWQHRFTRRIHSKIAGIYMWQRDAVVGGTPIIGPFRSFAGGGTKGETLPGLSQTYGILNFTMVQIAERDFVTIRNEWWRDDRGMRSGIAGHFSTHAIGLTHQFNDVVMIRPEAGFYRCYTRPAFDLSTEKNLYLIGADMIFRF